LGRPLLETARFTDLILRGTCLDTAFGRHQETGNPAGDARRSKETMRTKYLTLVAVAALLLVIAAASVFAVDRNLDAVKTARAEVAVISQPDVAPRPGTAARGGQDLRDSAALVLVGSMLLGLAAAVRRTA
jgi:uncharacterized membrane protein